jgi:ABC-type transport system involved in multi-copper enzyme maturation permease subunit
MAYIEFLRSRKALLWYTAITGGLSLLMVLIFNFASSGHVDIENHTSLDLTGLIGISVYCAAVFATVCGISLNRENDGVEMVFTKPISRERLALTYFLTDLAAIVLACVIATVFFGLVLLDLGAVTHTPSIIRFDGRSFGVLALGLGIAFMWYGLLQAASSRYVGNGGIFVGVSWALFGILIGLSQTPPGLLHNIIMTVNILNPLAYMTGISVSDSGGKLTSTAVSLFHGEPWARALMAWAIGLAGCAVATLGWKRLEV